MKEDNVLDKTLANLDRELRIRNYSRQTAESYLFYNKDILNFCRKDPKETAAAKN